MLKLRKATIMDLGQVIGLCHRGVSQGAWGKMPPFDPHHAVDLANRLIKMGLVFVLEDAEKKDVVGIHALQVTSWVWAPETVFIESIILYVMPEYRAQTVDLGINKVGAAEALMTVAKDLCTATGHAGSFPMMFGDHVDARDRFVQRCGVEYVGGNFLFMPRDEAVRDAAE